MTDVSNTEIKREARVCPQTLEMHHTLRDRYARRALIAELVMWGASIIFCATTFAADSLYSGVGLTPERARLLLGIASVLALIAASALILIDWKGAAARHADAARRWTEVSKLFRKHRDENKQWPGDVRGELHEAYWDAARNSIEIPNEKFNSLKAKYLLKVEISKRADRHPGAPRLVLWGAVRLAGTLGAVRESFGSNRKGGGDDDGQQAKAD